MKFNTECAPSASIDVAAPERRPVSPPIRSTAHVGMPPNSDDKNIRAVDSIDEAGSVSWPALTPLVIMSGDTRDAMSVTCCMAPRSLLLFAIAPNTHADERANPRDTVCSGTPSWMPISVSVDGFTTDVILLRRDSACVVRDTSTMWCWFRIPIAFASCESCIRMSESAT